MTEYILKRKAEKALQRVQYALTLLTYRTEQDNRSARPRREEDVLAVAAIELAEITLCEIQEE